MSAKKAAAADYAGHEFLITREFNAPRETVFEAWTKPEQIAQWWGPRGFTNPVCDWTPQPGRAIHVVMRAPNGVDYPMGGEFREIVAPERLVFTTGALDEKGALMFELLHTLTFTERDGKTLLTLQSRVIKTTPGAGRYIGGFEAGMTQSWERLDELTTATAAREIRVSRVFHAPRELVWQAMTDPKHVVNWWGPRGFSTTIETMDVRPGGLWKHTMHGPDGANYPNKSVFMEVVKPERIVYSHGGGREGGPGASFLATWSFDVVTPEQTRLTLRLVFPSAEARDFVVKEFGALEGAKQTLMRLSEHLAGVITEPFFITREFAAPRAVVWQAWTERDRLVQWWGPKGFTMSVATMDFRPGGMFHYCMLAPNGAEMWGRFVYREIAPPAKLVWVNSFSDKDGGMTSHPFSSDPWPLQLLTEVTFTETAGRTTVVVKFLPLDASAAELKVFDTHRDSMNQGWGGTMEQLATYLATP